MTTHSALLGSAAPRAMFHASVTASPMVRGAQVAYAPDGAAGGLTVDQAIASLIPQETEDTAPEAPAVVADEQPEPEGEASSPEEADEGAENPDAETETEAQETEAAAPLDAPKYWSKDGKEKFAQLSPELQAVVLGQEGPREEAAAKAKADAAKDVQTANAELAKVQTIADALSERLPQWIQTFESRWGQNPDWVAYAQQNGAEAMSIAKAQWEQEAQSLQAAAQQAQRAQGLAHEQYVKTEYARLSDLEPDLASPSDLSHGADKREAVMKFLIGKGIPREALPRISAAEMSIAYDAMRFREGQAALKAAPKPKTPTASARAPVRPAAAAPQSTPQGKAKEALGRFNAKPTMDNAIALLLTPKR